MHQIFHDAANPSRSLSNQQARALVRKLIAGFKRWGVRPGRKDVVCLHCSNDILYSCLFLGTIGAGGIFAATNPAYTPFELAYHIRTAEAKYIITEPETLGAITEAANECNIPRSNILIFNVNGKAVPQGFKAWETLLAHGEEDWIRFDDLDKARTTEAARLFSSGTTGLPKATMTSHYNLVAEHEIGYSNDNRDYRIRRLLCLPMFHAAAFPVAHTTTLKAGHISYVMRRFDLEGFLRNIEKYQITDIGMVPPMVEAATLSPLSKQYNLQSVRSALCGAAPLGKTSQLQFGKLLNCDVPFTQGWGRSSTPCLGLYTDLV